MNIHRLYLDILDFFTVQAKQATNNRSLEGTLKIANAQKRTDFKLRDELANQTKFGTFVWKVTEIYRNK